MWPQYSNISPELQIHLSSASRSYPPSLEKKGR